MEGNRFIWDPSTLKYVKDETRLGSTLSQASTANDDAEVSITVTNKSNAIVKYAIEYESKKNSGTNISTATQTTTDKESGTLESAAKDVTPTLTGSPEDTVSTGKATSETYTATVALAKKGEDYVASCSDTELVMGTYTVSITTASYTIYFDHNGDISGLMSSLYSFDGVNNPEPLDCDMLMAEEALITTKYVVYKQRCWGPSYVSSINTGTCANLVKLSELSDTEIAKLKTINYYDSDPTLYDPVYISEGDIYDGRTTDFADNEYAGYSCLIYVFKIIDDGTITLNGYWHD